MMMMRFTCMALIITFAMISKGYSRELGRNDELISDGIHEIGQTPILKLDLRSTNVTCEATYGFLPCTTLVWGQLFLFFVYQVMLSFAADCSSRASDLFFVTSQTTNIFASTIFDTLSIIPQLIMAIAPAYFSSSDTIETLATMGMATLTGSTVFQLTAVWGCVVVLGNNQQRCISQTRISAAVMHSTILPFLILIIADFLTSTSAIRVVVIVSLSITSLFFVIYFCSQLFNPLFKGRIEYLTRRHILTNLNHYLRNEDAFVTKLLQKSNIVDGDDSEIDSMVDKIDDDDGVATSIQDIDNPRWNYMQAASWLLLGTGLSLLFSKALLQTIKAFATNINVSPFMISYFVVPIAMGYKQAFKSIESARQNTKNSFTSTFSEIYGTVIMKNLTGLITFLSLVIAKDLTWDVSAEILVISMVCFVMGFPAWLCTKIQTWMGYFAWVLYAASIGLLYTLIVIYGWS